MAQPDLSLNKIANSRLEGRGNIFSQVKIDILALLSVFFALAFSWSLDRLIHNALPQYFGFVLVSAFLFSAIFLYKAIFIREANVSAFLVFLDCAALTIFFIEFTWAAIFVFLTVFLLLITANRSGRWFIENNLKISFWKMAHLVLPKAMISLFLIPSIFTPLNYRAQDQKFPLPQKVFDAAIDYSAKFVETVVPGVNMRGSIEEETHKLVLDKIRADEQLKFFSLQAQEQIVKESQKSVYDQLSDWMGIKINPSEKISTALYDGLRQKFVSQSAEIKSLVFVLIGLLIFLSLASLLWPIRLVVAVIAWVGYELLISFGFARIVKEETTKETIVIE